MIRIAAGVWIRHGKFEGRLSQYRTRPGMRRLLRGVQYRKVRSLVQNIVVVWRKDKREPWFLMTDLNQGANPLCNLYGKRMLDRIQLQIMTMLRAVCQAILEECEKWGQVSY